MRYPQRLQRILGVGCRLCYFADRRTNGRWRPGRACVLCAGPPCDASRDGFRGFLHVLMSAKRHGGQQKRTLAATAVAEPRTSVCPVRACRWRDSKSHCHRRVAHSPPPMPPHRRRRPLCGRCRVHPSPPERCPQGFGATCRLPRLLGRRNARASPSPPLAIGACVVRTPAEKHTAGDGGARRRF